MIVAAALGLTWRLAPEQERPGHRRWLVEWGLKGLLLPLLFWALMNLGLSWDLQPFMPEIQAVQNKGGHWFPLYCQFVAGGLFVISSDWAAVTLAWAVWQAGQGLDQERLDELKALRRNWLACLLVPAIIVALIGGWPALGLAGAVILAPIAAGSRNILIAPKRSPIYSRAVAKLKFGKYAEAEREVLRQLETCDDDFEGWMMMADLYANHFRDLALAQQTILDICNQPKVTLPQVSIALHRLADWHLNLAQDPRAARRALQMLCDHCAGTHLARMAQIRIDQLPGTAEELRQEQTAQTIPMPALGDQLDQSPAPESPLDRRDAARLANQCVEKLKRNPDDPHAREKLARLLAEHLDRVDSGVEQLRLLLEMPGQADSLRVEWLGLMAAWHLKYRKDESAARAVLERVLRDFPHTPQAIAAKRRLQLLEAQHRVEAAKPPSPPKTIRLSPE